jgi:serine/threonine-protein kinase
MKNGALLNAKIGEYRLIDFLGAGGMGEVYRGVHAKLGRVVAVKVLTQSQRNPRLMERFYNEAQIQARLHHPRIATLFDFLETDSMPCIVMEYIDGQTLDERIRMAGALSPEEALAIFQDVVEAIAYVHDHDIVHRDIKSNNIKINSRGEVKLLDFGIAKSDASPQLTAMGDVIGTLQYLSPEQLKGGTADGRSDIWALGVLLYEMVSGQVPFNATTLGRLCESISKSDYVPPSTYNPSLPKAVEAIIKRCLKKSPEARYQSAQEILKDLAELRKADYREDAVPANGLVIAEISAWHWARQNRQLLALVVAGVISLSLLAFFLLQPTIDRPVNRNRNTATTTSSTRTVPPGESNALKTVRIDTLEGKADVYQNGQLVGQTPYEIKATSGEQVSLILKRNGFEDKPVAFSITETAQDYTFTLNRKP